MERYSQFRDRGSGIAPFFPIQAESSGLYLPFHLFLFCCRVPLLATVAVTYFLVLHWLPLGLLTRKAALWLMIGIPGIWWIDLQIDGVKKGSLAKHHQARLPQPGSIIASSFTSPIDALYLAAIFDPIFTASYPRTRFVHQISLFQAIVRAFQQPQTAPPTTSKLVDLGTLMKQNPNRIIIVFPECTTTNGRGVLPFSTSLLTTPARTKIFPISLRYTPADITTPLPETYFSFLYSLCSKPTHCIRVRIAQSIEGIASPHIPDKTDDTSSSSETLLGSETGEELNIVNGKMLMQIGSALARLGRSKQVGLGVESKQEFLKVWNKHSR